MPIEELCNPAGDVFALLVDVLALALEEWRASLHHRADLFRASRHVVARVPKGPMHGSLGSVAQIPPDRMCFSVSHTHVLRWL